jgi:hypothetical protein
MVSFMGFVVVLCSTKEDDVLISAVVVIGNFLPHGGRED